MAEPAFDSSAEQRAHMQDGERVPRAVDCVPFAGPWHVVQAHDGCWRVREGLTVWMWRATREAAQAAADEENRRWRQRQVELAAPDMLAVLKRIRDSYRGYIPDFIEAVNSVIAKAEPSR